MYEHLNDDELAGLRASAQRLVDQHERNLEMLRERLRGIDAELDHRRAK